MNLLSTPLMQQIMSWLQAPWSVHLLELQALDWRAPWCWPRGYRWAVWAGAVLVGFVLGALTWLDAWQAWPEARAAHARMQVQHQALEALAQQTHQIEQSLMQPPLTTPDAQQFAAAAPPALVLSQLSLGELAQTPALRALQLTQLRMQLQLQGTWALLQTWLAQWPQAAPGAIVTGLHCKAHPLGGITSQVQVWLPQANSATLASAAPTSDDPFDATQWVATQHEHAQQHPSYAQRVVPQLRRPREPLEAFELSQLHYVGHIAQGAKRDALLRVSASGAARAPSAVPTPLAALPPLPSTGVSTPIHRIQVGAYVGPNFGRVQAIEPDQVQLQELVLDPRGAWVYRAAQLARREGAP